MKVMGLLVRLEKKTGGTGNQKNQVYQDHSIVKIV